MMVSDMESQMEKDWKMKLEAENLELKNQICRLEEELRNCHAALQFASERADIDYLTGIYNRNGITRLVDGFLGMEKAEKGALCFLDLDNFKQINDQYGHKYGDEVLCNVVQSICRNMQESDVVGRFGGDEFVIYLRMPEGIADITGRAENICRGIRQEQGCHGLTASIGIARYPEDGRQFTELIEKADSALYESKKEGKDQIRFISEE